MSKTTGKKPAPQAQTPAPAHQPDPAALGAILAETAERLQPLVAEFMSKIDWDVGNQPLDPLNTREAWATFFQNLYRDPDRLTKLQMQYMNNWVKLWSDATQKFMGNIVEDSYKPDISDRRFKSAAWQDSALFDLIKQSYLMTSQWMQNAVHDTEGLDEKTRHKLEFYTRQFVDAMAPSNFLMTNPDVIQATLDSKGENLMRGMKNMIEDLERGKGHLKISTTDYDAFAVGKNLATTPGQVIFQNDLIQLIQYDAVTDKVHQRPLLIVPPWINKYYILDLRPDNSFVKWLTEQGHTVFIVSWVNPNSHLSRKSFADYMDEGILAALTHIAKATGEPDCNVIGYCIGGTLLATTLAWLATQGKDTHIASATFLTTLIDFTDSGDIKVFIDDAQLHQLDEEMKGTGVFHAKNLKDTFSLLRANDMIWSFVINNYLLGKEPFPFDLLYWNDDSTNMPAEMHSFYLRNMYRDNKLAKPGALVIKNTPIDVHKVKTPVYFLSTKEDHIAPWRATYAGTQMFSGPISFTLSGSGHVAGVINAPVKNKYGYWTAAEHPAAAEDWFDHATQHDGSWWSHWNTWITPYAGKMVPARTPKNPIEPAPGSYVKMKAED